MLKIFKWHLIFHGLLFCPPTHGPKTRRRTLRCPNHQMTLHFQLKRFVFSISSTPTLNGPGFLLFVKRLSFISVTFEPKRIFFKLMTRLVSSRLLPPTHPLFVMFFILFPPMSITIRDPQNKEAIEWNVLFFCCAAKRFWHVNFMSPLRQNDRPTSTPTPQLILFMENNSVSSH